GLVLAALVAGIVGTTVGLVWANAARKDAETAKIAEGERAAEAVREKARAEKGEKLAGERLVQVEAEKKRAEEEKRVALAVQDFLQHKLLSQADPNIQAGAILRQGGQTSEVKENPTVRELLDRAAKELAPDMIEASFPKQPLVQAHILNTVGVTYHSVGEYRKAIDLLERSTAILTAHAGADHDDTLTVMNHLANAHRSVGNHRRNIELKERIRDMRLKKLGADHQATLTATNNLAHAYRQTDDVHLNSLAIKLMEQLRDTYAKRPDDANISAIVSLWNLIFWYPIGDERIARSLALMERIRDAHTAKFGPDAPATLHANYQVAWAYHNARRLPQAAELFERVLEAQGRILGVDHPETLTTGRRLVDAYLGQNPTVGQRRNYPRAAELMERIHADTLARLGPTHLLTLNSFATLALTYSRMGRHDKAIQLHEELLKRKEAQFGRQHISTLSTVCRLGMCYKDAGRQAEGLALYEEAFWNPRTGPRERLWVGDELLDARVKEGRPKEAAKLAKELVAVARRWSATDPLTFIDRLCNYSERLTSVKAFEEAEPLLQEATAISEQQPPEKQWRKYRTMSVRGACLVEQR
ncbi:MAG: tetratricopeptide repeat protein, partial [Gemmataceae bacterium]